MMATTTANSEQYTQTGQNTKIIKTELTDHHNALSCYQDWHLTLSWCHHPIDSSNRKSSPNQSTNQHMPPLVK